MMGRWDMPTRLVQAALIAICIAGPTTAQDANAEGEVKPDVVANTLPSLEQQEISGVEIVDLRVSCNLKKPLSTAYSMTFKKDGKNVTEALFEVTADRCKYIFDPTARTHKFMLNVALNFVPTAPRAAACPNVSAAFLLRIGSASVDLPWRGKTFVLRDGALVSPEVEGESGHSLSMVNLTALQNSTAKSPASFATYLYADLLVFSDRAENWTKRETFSYGLAAAAPLSEGAFFEDLKPANVAAVSQPAAAMSFTKTKDIVVDLEVLDFKAACLADDRAPTPAVLKEK